MNFKVDSEDEHCLRIFARMDVHISDLAPIFLTQNPLCELAL